MPETCMTYTYYIQRYALSYYYVSRYVCVHIYIHTYICIYIYIFMYMYAHIHTTLDRCMHMFVMETCHVGAYWHSQTTACVRASKQAPHAAYLTRVTWRRLYHSWTSVATASLTSTNFLQSSIRASRSVPQGLKASLINASRNLPTH